MIEVRIDEYASKIDKEDVWHRLYVVVHTAIAEDILNIFPNQSGYPTYELAANYADILCEYLIYCGRKEVTLGQEFRLRKNTTNYRE